MQNKEKDLNQRIERYWDTRSPAFAKVRRQELAGPNANCWAKLLAQHLPGKRLKILDVGMGAGFLTAVLYRLGHEVTGIDMSHGMVREAGKNLLALGCRAELKKMDAQALDFPTGTFDAVISRNLTWTLPDAMQAYREWQRVLKAGGWLLNFDADRGEVTFERRDDPADVHAGIGQDLIAECNDIKASLRISTHRRPEWDVGCLREMGFAVTYEADIAPLVQADPGLHYDGTPLFAIYAQNI